MTLISKKRNIKICIILKYNADFLCAVFGKLPTKTNFSIGEGVLLPSFYFEGQKFLDKNVIAYSQRKETVIQLNQEYP